MKPAARPKQTVPASTFTEKSVAADVETDASGRASSASASTLRISTANKTALGIASSFKAHWAWGAGTRYTRKHKAAPTPAPTKTSTVLFSVVPRAKRRAHASSMRAHGTPTMMDSKTNSSVWRLPITTGTNAPITSATAYAITEWRSSMTSRTEGARRAITFMTTSVTTMAASVPRSSTRSTAKEPMLYSRFMPM